MKQQLIVFGTGDSAQLAKYYFDSDSRYDVAAFTVDSDYITASDFMGRPLVPFEEVATRYSPGDFDAFVALGYSRLNALRKEKYLALKALGYRLATYVSSRATVLNEGRIGENCFVLEDNTIQPFVHIGDNVTLWSGNHIGHHSVVADHCFIASHVVISGGVTIGEQCFVGVNATVRDRVTIGERCVIGAGAVILGDAAPEGVYMHQPTERSKVPSSRLKRI